MNLGRATKQLIKAVGSPVIDSLGVYRRRIDRVVDQPGSWTILMYHRVITDPAADPFSLGMCVTRERFAAQVSYFRRHFNPIGVAEANALLMSGGALPPRALSITFDDGYLDNLTNALPILEAHGMPAAVFVPTGGLDCDEMLWWDRVIAAVACTVKPHIDLAELGIAGTESRLSLAPWKQEASVAHLLDRLWALQAAPLRAAVDRIERVLQPRLTPALKAGRLNSEQVRALHARGIEIGAHSVGHPNLALSSVAETRDELQASRSKLQQILQADVPGMAYPGGRLRAETIQIAQELGFQYALATRIGTNKPPPSRFELRRIGMPNASMPDLRRAFGRALAGNLDQGMPTF